MKRKFSEINNELTIKKPKYLPCDICKRRIYNYEMCTSPFCYCSIDCLSIIILTEQNRMLHESENTFEMKRVEAKDELMFIDYEDNIIAPDHST